MEQESTSKASALKALESLRMRLLDLSARNQLINFRHANKRCLRIIDELPNQLVETLLSDTEARFLPIPEPTEEELIKAGYLKVDDESQQVIRVKEHPIAEQWAQYLDFATSYEVPKSAVEDSNKHSDTAIQTLLYPSQMEVRLKSLLQTAESAIEEMGANILYLAFGFLEWHDSYDHDSRPRFAPLFLVPVRLHKGRLNKETKTYEYTLSYSGEDIIPNLSLKEKLRADFAMELPSLDENTEPEDYFQKVQKLIQNKQPRWHVRRFISLALLNFSKLLMYLDLGPERWPKGANIIDHPVVNSFLGDHEQETEDNSVGDFGFGEEYLIDEIDEIHAKYPLIDDADSSQHSALIDAVNGKNLIIEGPPGTGKSQTITNLIAAAMVQGKKVLFVAEKLAALEVVRSRLDAKGLGQFCLELHSHKSQKRQVLEEISERLKKHRYYRKPKNIDIDITHYEKLKTVLKTHAGKINQPWRNTNKTLHEIFMAATRYRNTIEINPEEIHPEGYDGYIYDAEKQRRNEDQVEVFGRLYQAVVAQLKEGSALHEHPWCGVCNSDLQIFDLNKVHGLLRDWQTTLQFMNTEREKIAQTIGCEPADVAGTLKKLASFLDQLERIPDLQGDEVLETLPILRGNARDEMRRYIQQFRVIQELYALLAKQVGSDVLQDLTSVDQLLQGSEQLKQLVSPRTQLKYLAKAIERLLMVQDQLEQLDEPLLGIAVALDRPASKHLTLSRSGLAEFKTVIRLISTLSPSCWKHRDGLFDNEELDELLPKLRNEIKELQSLHNLIYEAFSLNGLPSESEIRQLKNTLDMGGPFRWFKGSWRDARKRIVRHAANAQVKFSRLEPLLSELADYSGKHQRLEENPHYLEAFGNHFQGIKTDIDALEELRGWYREVRFQYGIGFGQKVPLGDVILELSPSTITAVRSLSQRGAQNQLSKLLENLDNLEEVFISGLHNNNAPLIGAEGIIPNLLTKVDKAVRACQPLVEDSSLSIRNIVDRSEQIGLLKKKIEKWSNKSDISQTEIQRLLARLEVGVEVDNTAGLSALNNTLSLAVCVEGQLDNQMLTKFIYQNPTASTFDTLAQHAQALRSAISKQEEAYKAFKTLARLNRDSWVAQCGEQIENLIARNQLALDDDIALDKWLNYVRIRVFVESLGLSRLVDSVEKSDVPIEQIKDAYQAGIFDVLAKEILREEPELGQFSGTAQEVLQEKFREYDNNLKQLQCEQIAWKIDQAKVPEGKTGARVGDYTEKVLLGHECHKKTRHIPIRQLLQRAGKALVELKPCFMMGPMSVAQYLPPGKIAFDLVIMDEASQIKPQDALGTVARGKQLVVVGDSKQLPPTSFFDRIVDGNEEDPTAIEESESILDATRLMFRARRLRWHYRSQHESLIAFSNHFFYENNLVLFPSPHKQTENYGIHHSRVRSGCFVNRRNLEEARIICEAVKEHFKRHPEETLGVVAMNAEQRLQIEGEVETLEKNDSMFKEWLDKDAARHESLFIKNLENVQGDERDVIFISMTYGPQEPGGSVYQRFGPINSDMGWRRLNVLFTRSRRRMHVFSSMGSEHVQTGATKTRGVQALHDFLKYCETKILHKTELDTARRPDSDFEIAVMNALHDAGFKCVPQVGVAGFFIDIAVMDPGNPGRYLMGIECDGATYHSAKSARDRDRLRQMILERLGWNIRRIWSTDWFKNPHGELQPIIRELHTLKSAIKPIVESIESEVDEIRGVVKEVNTHEALADSFTFNETTLEDKLARLNSEVISKEFPHTPEKKRLLRPAMMEALLAHTPTSQAEFLEVIPCYIREGTEAAEGKYLEQVFNIINASLEEISGPTPTPKVNVRSSCDGVNNTVFLGQYDRYKRADKPK